MPAPTDRKTWRAVLADVQEHSQEALYVDRIHYAPRSSKELAGRIVHRLLKQALLGSGAE
jgi:hypothetical protein